MLKASAAIPPVLDWTAFRADSYPGLIMELTAVMRCAYAGYSLWRGPEIPATPASLTRPIGHPLRTRKEGRATMLVPRRQPGQVAQDNNPTLTDISG